MKIMELILGVLFGCAIVGALMAWYALTIPAAQRQPATSPPNIANETAPATGPSPEEEFEPGDEEPLWSVTETTDPMTDETVKTGTHVAHGQHFIFVISVSCRSNGVIAYSFSAFDQHENAAPFRPYSYSDTSVFKNSGLAVDFRLRVDGEPAYKYTDRRPIYSNQVGLASSLDDTRMFRQFTTHGWAEASKLTAQFQLLNGSDVIEIPQSDQAFTEMVSSCLSSRRNDPG